MAATIKNPPAAMVMGLNGMFRRWCSTPRALASGAALLDASPLVLPISQLLSVLSITRRGGRGGGFEAVGATAAMHASVVEGTRRRRTVLHLETWEHAWLPLVRTLRFEQVLYRIWFSIRPPTR